MISPVKPVCLCYTCFPSGSAGKGSACNAGDHFDSRGGKIRWRRDRLPMPVFLGFPDGLTGKESTCNAGDLGLIPGLGRPPGEGNSYPLQYSGLENSMDYIVYGVSKNWTRLSDFHFILLLMFKCCPWSLVFQDCVFPIDSVKPTAVTVSSAVSPGRWKVDMISFLMCVPLSPACFLSPWLRKLSSKPC